jgi:hypothetical protein
MKIKKDAEDKLKKDLADREKASLDCWEAYKKISYQGEVDERGINTIIWRKISL